ncbi:MAG: hypothetical protein CMK28_04850 [Porticoccaceae bacterium]|nr:hypothetical protein [Porticoccaceae bacterium]
MPFLVFGKDRPVVAPKQPGLFFVGLSEELHLCFDQIITRDKLYLNALGMHFRMSKGEHHNQHSFLPGGQKRVGT